MSARKIARLSRCVVMNLKPLKTFTRGSEFLSLSQKPWSVGHLSHPSELVPEVKGIVSTCDVVIPVLFIQAQWLLVANPLTGLAGHVEVATAGSE